MKLSTVIFITFLLTANSLFGNVAIINGLTQVKSGTSGDVIQGEVVLLNTSNEEQRVIFEINEALFSCSGPRIYTEKNPHAQSSSSWFSAEVADKVLAAKEKYVYKYTITIPDDQNLRGSYWNMLMVTIEKPIKEETLNDNVGLNTKLRYGVGIITNVNSLDEVNLYFDQVDLKNEGETPVRQLEVRINNGGLFVEGVVLSLEVYDQEGNKVNQLSTDRNMAFPGACKSFYLDVSVLEPGDYQCILLAESRDEFAGTSLSLTIQ
jgi:hypothetical protein